MKNPTSKISAKAKGEFVSINVHSVGYLISIPKAQNLLNDLSLSLDIAVKNHIKRMESEKNK